MAMEVEESHTTEKILLPWKWHHLKRRMLAGCELFAQGDEALWSVRKFIPLDDDPASDEGLLTSDSTKEAFPCCVVGCSYICSSLLSYENHYNSQHRHACSSCRRVFPSALLLDIHIQENHDPLFAILATRQNLMYRCLVETCAEKFSLPRERHDHLVRIHKYPTNFRFHKDKHHGNRMRDEKTIKGKDTMEIDTNASASVSRLNHPNLGHESSRCTTCDSVSSENLTATASCECVIDKEEISSTMELSQHCENVETKTVRRVFVHKVPKTFSFGHGASQMFQRPSGKKKKKKGGHWHEQTVDSSVDTTIDIENVDMADIAQALQETVS